MHLLPGPLARPLHRNTTAITQDPQRNPSQTSSRCIPNAWQRPPWIKTVQIGTDTRLPLHTISYSPVSHIRRPATLGGPLPKCKTPPGNSSSTVPPCREKHSRAREEGKINGKAKRKIKEPKHHPVGTYPLCAAFDICPCCQEIHTVECSRAIDVPAEAGSTRGTHSST